MAINDRLRDQQTIEWSLLKHLMGVTVIALTHPVDRVFFGNKVEKRIYLILAIGEEEPHLACDLVDT